MNEPGKLNWIAAVLALLLAGAAGCGSDGNIKSESIASEAKDNMTAVKGDADTAARASRVVRKPVVLFFGTSLTAEAGLEPEQAFPALVEKKADSAGLPIRAVNAGLSGETTAGAVRRIDWVLRTPADVIVVETGANDALRGLSPVAAKANIEKIIASIKKKQPGATIVLAQFFAPPNFGNEYTRSFSAIYADVAKRENVVLIPFLLEGVAGVSRYNQPDGIHPNSAGERLVADNVWRGLQPVIAQLDRVRGAG
jgi:acyl-CoA thioesterase I